MSGGGMLRVASYNLHCQRDDRGALAAVVRELAPDVLIVQEAPRGFGWRHRCAALARAFGLVMAVGGPPALGNLILTRMRVRVDRTWCVRFPLTPGRHLRGGVFARCEVDGFEFTVAGSHLSIDPVERPGQAKLLAQALAQAQAPLVVGADLNDEPGSPTWQTVAGALADPGGAVPTYSCADPRRRIDAILVDPSLTVDSYQVVDTPLARRASDHFPVVADLAVTA